MVLFYNQNGYMGVSKNSGTLNGMVKIMGKPYFLMDDLGGKQTTIFGNPRMFYKHLGDQFIRCRFLMW